MLPNGTPKRLETFIDIPLEIGLPHFISDERMKEEGPLFGNFKLVLQSVVCHRGVSVDSGHYVSLVRGNVNERPGTSQSEEDHSLEPWLRLDDLANPRVAEVDIKKALHEESPYLLFYQVQPIDEELAMRGEPPAYDETPSGLTSVDPSEETLVHSHATDTDLGGQGDKSTTTHVRTESFCSDEPISRNSVSSNRRSSVAFDESEVGSHSASRGPATPDEQKTGFLSISRRGSRAWLPGGNRSRTSSPTGENRLSITLSRLTGRGSKDKLVVTETAAADDHVIVVGEAQDADKDLPNHSPVKEKKDAGQSASKSKKEKKDKMRSKSKEPKEGLEKGKDKEKKRPDRECTVM
jgi:hypothetical protein